MIMADVFKILFLILGLILCTMSYWLLFQALFSGTVEKSRRAMLDHPWRIFLIGALAGIPLVVLGLAMLSNGAGPVKFLGGALASGILLVALLGSTGLVRHIGEQLSGNAVEGRTGLAVLRGGAVIAVASVLPVVGWFVLIPAVLIAGFGAALRLLWTRQPPATVAPAANPVQP